MLVFNFLHGLLNSAKKFFIVFIALSSRFFRHFTCIVYCKKFYTLFDAFPCCFKKCYTFFSTFPLYLPFPTSSSNSTKCFGGSSISDLNSIRPHHITYSQFSLVSPDTFLFLAFLSSLSLSLSDHSHHYYYYFFFDLFLAYMIGSSFI